ITGEYKSPSISFAGITLTSTNANGDAFIANNISTSDVTPSICMVTTDTITETTNIIYWSNTYPTASRYIIHREVSTGVYKPIGSVVYDSLSMFIDTVRSIGPANGNPNIGTYRYKLQILDTAGTYSLLSPYHNTVYFVSNNNGTFTWNTYNVEGQSVTPVTQFDLLRDNLNTNTWVYVGSVAGTQTTLNDPSYSTYSTTGNWCVSALGFNCTPTRSAISTSRSNIKGARLTGINTVQQNINIVVYPNPLIVV
ncbi:MAG TPA: hypothetical protein VNX68_08000, partial [Nitrosopumilaceae archaeon]|nr:hypothetical protein [Nitrosopumilaceae archaeon]